MIDCRKKAKNKNRNIYHHTKQTQEIIRKNIIQLIIIVFTIAEINKSNSECSTEYKYMQKIKKTIKSIMNLYLCRNKKINLKKKN